ncbi:nardilysin [Halyomorpha halys]|uniref:nardilysin n=1 Tax=Halyomorpha halys TaxID=286706 RepID=UPI0006D504A8|nr:nardilysin [Halyomorpha halys]
MYKNCTYLLTNIYKTMSKKCKVEMVKHVTNLSNQNLTAAGSIDVLQHSINTKSDISSINSGSSDVSMLDTLSRLETPIKSENDKKEYSVIRLANGLTALLISDVSNIIELSDGMDTSEDSESDLSETESMASGGSESSSKGSENERHLAKKEEKLAACSLTVGVGSFSDPNDIPGLAHFLEHMVFMGSKKFPKENEFDSFIKKHGGSDNASTECEYTTYYFECQDKFMPKALDIFSQFFISPLMKREAMTREREAVESEFTIALPSDVYRRQQMLSSTASPNNPGGKFVWGNLKTLRDDVTDDYLYESVHKFREKHYSAHRMTLAIQARVTIETLEKWVVKYFSDIPSNNFDPIKPTEPHENLFDKNKFNQMYFIESVNDNILLELNWHLPPTKSLYKYKPANVLSWVIGHEGKGSLISYLRNKLWALGLSAGHNEDGLADNTIYSIFTISIILTENGLKNLEKVLDATFSYIKMTQNHGPDERAFLELQKIAAIDFKYDEETPAIDNVEFLSDNMQHYPPQDYIRGGELFFEFEPTLINNFLNQLTPSNVNVVLSKKIHNPEIILDQTEPWFKTRYCRKDIPTHWIQNWQNIEQYPQFTFPAPNEYITSDFTILHQNTEGPIYPEKIFSSDQLDIWFKPDTKFKLPLGFIGFQIVNKNVFESTLENTLLSMYTTLLNHLLVEELYPANMALLEYSVSTVDRAFVVEVYGFNEKLDILLKKIAKHIKSFNENITEDLLQAFIETNKKSHYNNNLKISNLAREVRMSIILDRFFTSVDKYNTLPLINLDLVKEFSDNFFKNVHIQCLVQGNILKDKALEICQTFVSQLETGILPVEIRPKILVYELPNTEKCCRLMSFNMRDSNCITTNYYQMGPGGVREYCVIDLLMMLMEEPLFDRLRTQEQLGYDVSGTIRESYGILGFSITVVSQIYKHSVDHVEERISAFLINFLESLIKMPRNEFDEVVQALINIKKCCDLHIKEEIKRNWAEIKCFEYAFDRLEREIRLLSILEPEDVISFLKTRIDGSNPNHKKLTIQVVGYDSKMEEDNELEDNNQASLPSNLSYNIIKEAPNKEESYFIKDIHDFKSQMSLYPESKVFKL